MYNLETGGNLNAAHAIIITINKNKKLLTELLTMNNTDNVTEVLIHIIFIQYY